jgi:hypothetical protein
MERSSTPTLTSYVLTAALTSGAARPLVTGFGTMLLPCEQWMMLISSQTGGAAVRRLRTRRLLAVHLTESLSQS